MSPLEKMARAHYARLMGGRPAWEDLNPYAQAEMLESMSAALLAIREPDEVMRKAIDDLSRTLIQNDHERDQHSWFALKAYRAQIQAILAEEPRP